MDLIHTVTDMQALAEQRRAQGDRLALVPTMGALHEGHLELVRTAQERADHVTVSVFVNPTQFGPDEDFDTYPRDLEGDRAKLDDLGVDALFAPAVEEMYPHRKQDQMADALTWVLVDELDQYLCGRYRDGHFRGVTTVVAKLFNACRPHVAVFGQKDAQQLVIIRRMAEELLFGIDIVGVPIVREEDGLARSSRNVYLNDGERTQATVLSAAVQAAREHIEDGEQDPSAIVAAMDQVLAQAPDADVQYADLVDARSLKPVKRLVPGQDVLAAVAVFFGGTRLIDNAFVTVPAS